MSKATTLLALAGLSGGYFIVDPLQVFTVADWCSSADEIVAKLQGHSEELGPTVAVRSSARSEGARPTVAPGTYRSFLDVRLANRLDLARAIDGVVESYGIPTAQRHVSFEEVIVQRQVEAATMSGVATSLDDRVSPYLTIEYDDETGRTDAVTRGLPCKRWIIVRGPAQVDSEPWRTLAAAANRICEILAADDVVIEFAITGRNDVHIFQAWIRGRVNLRITPQRLADITQSAERVLAKAPAPVWSQMADWNPTEVIGRSPGRLATSLYSSLITNSIWAKARAQMGYYDVRPTRLMRIFAAQPFVDVRSSLLSLTPSDVTADLRDRYVQACLAHLVDNPEIHDKIELRLIVASGVLSRRDRRLDFLSDQDATSIAGAATRLANGLLVSATQLLATAHGDLEKLQAWRTANPLRQVAEANPIAQGRYAIATLAKIKQFGTLPFSRVARLAFVCRDLLEQLSALGAVDGSDTEAFWRGLGTVAGDVAEGLMRVAVGSSSPAQFTEMYGHLRPSTYDITSKRYDSPGVLERLIEAGVTPIPSQLPSRHTSMANIGSTARLKVGRHLLKVGLQVDPEQFFRIGGAAFRARELHKFCFSAALSDLLEVLACIGMRHSVSRMQLYHLSFHEILALDTLGASAAVEKIKQQLEYVQDNTLVRLPAIMTAGQSLHSYEVPFATPNIVGRGTVTAPPALINERIGDRLYLANRVVLIEAADPGYDWIFSCGIAGLVTCYGGIASHMAIRAAEFGLPAAIGVGPDRFTELTSAPLVSIDVDLGVVGAVR